MYKIRSRTCLKSATYHKFVYAPHRRVEEYTCHLPQYLIIQIPPAPILSQSDRSVLCLITCFISYVHRFIDSLVRPPTTLVSFPFASGLVCAAFTTPVAFLLESSLYWGSITYDFNTFTEYSNQLKSNFLHKTEGWKFNWHRLWDCPANPLPSFCPICRLAFIASTYHIPKDSFSVSDPQPAKSRKLHLGSWLPVSHVEIAAGACHPAWYKECAPCPFLVILSERVNRLQIFVPWTTCYVCHGITSNRVDVIWLCM